MKDKGLKWMFCEPRHYYNLFDDEKLKDIWEKVLN